MTVAHQASPSMRFSRQEYWSGLPFPSPGDLLHLGIELRSPALKADTLPSEPPGKSRRCLILQVLLGGGEVQRTQSPLEWVLIKEKQKMGESRKQTDPDKTLFQDIIVSDNRSGTTCGTKHPAMFSYEIVATSATLFIGLSAFISHFPLTYSGFLGIAHPSKKQ